MEILLIIKQVEKVIKQHLIIEKKKKKNLRKLQVIFSEILNDENNGGKHLFDISTLLLMKHFCYQSSLVCQ